MASKILLDSPLPKQLSTVESCSCCNEQYSLDEEYFACFLECVICGSSDPDLLKRQKIKTAMHHSPDLRTRINRSQQGTVWQPEMSRIHNIVLKLARGHAAYELSLPMYEVPEFVNAIPFDYLSEEERDSFEKSASTLSAFFPEIGSRVFYRLLDAHPYVSQEGPWVIVQAERYRYIVSQSSVTVFEFFLLSIFLINNPFWESRSSIFQTY